MTNNTLAINGGEPTISANVGQHYIWPRITQATDKAVLAQNHAAISLRKTEGVFADFIDAFLRYHGCKDSHRAILVNSGTSALWAIYVGARLGPGDEVIVPSYTFYATYSPLMQTGATPIFCDAGPDGNIDPDEIESLITPHTKAVMVTHMWGMPCDMPAIRAICDRHGLLLFEDCSHAHGAEIGGRKVGTWGDAAAWSLQGQKLVTGGEGGIMITSSHDLFNWALPLTDYNTILKEELDPSHPVFQFALTGYGLKLRAHPVPIAMALEQFGHLDEWITQKQRYADQMSAALAEFPFIQTPCSSGQPAWYAYTLQFLEDQANGVTVGQFHTALLAEGLREADRPGSTCPNHGLPLFTRPHEVLPHLYSGPLPKQGPFPGAERFHRQAIKLPVWAFADEERWIQLYIAGIEKVARAVRESPELLMS